MTTMNEMGEFVDTTPPQPWERIVDAPKNPATFDMRTCGWCGERFTPIYSAQKFCSDVCRKHRQEQIAQKHNEQRREERRKKREQNR